MLRRSGWVQAAAEGPPQDGSFLRRVSGCQGGRVAASLGGVFQGVGMAALGGGLGFQDGSFLGRGFQGVRVSGWQLPWEEGRKYWGTADWRSQLECSTVCLLTGLETALCRTCIPSHKLLRGEAMIRHTNSKVPFPLSCE